MNHDIEISKEDLIDDYKLQLLRFQVQICDIKAHKLLENDKRLVYIDSTKKLMKEYEN